MSEGNEITMVIDGVPTDFVRKDSIQTVDAGDYEYLNPGRDYFIQTVTAFYQARLVAVTDRFLVVKDGAWVPDTGRFSDFIKGKDADEIEPLPDGLAHIGIGAIILIVERKGLFRSQK